MRLCKTSFILSEAVTTGFLEKKVFLKISQNSQGNTYGTVFFLNKVASLKL